MRLLRNPLTETVLPRLLSKTKTSRTSEFADDSGQEIDLTESPNWDDVADLAEDFDRKIESFMAFDDGSDGSERIWLTN